MRFLPRLVRETGGSSAVEFALIAPTMLAMMMGIIQVGVGMQEYNALRGVAADVARYAVVQYQTASNAAGKPTAAQLAAYGDSVARSSPYNLPRTGLLITVTQPATQRVTGATEFTITVRAQVNNIIKFVDFNDYYITYSRPIFVLT